MPRLGRSVMGTPVTGVRSRGESGIAGISSVKGVGVKGYGVLWSGCSATGRSVTPVTDDRPCGEAHLIGHSVTGCPVAEQPDYRVRIDGTSGPAVGYRHVPPDPADPDSRPPAVPQGLPAPAAGLRGAVADLLSEMDRRGHRSRRRPARDQRLAD